VTKSRETLASGKISLWKAKVEKRTTIRRGGGRKPAAKTPATSTKEVDWRKILYHLAELHNGRSPVWSRSTMGNERRNKKQKPKPTKKKKNTNPNKPAPRKSLIFSRNARKNN